MVAALTHIKDIEPNIDFVRDNLSRDYISGVSLLF